MTHRSPLSLLASATLVSLFAFVPAPSADAQDSGVVQRLVTQGKMPQPAARALVRKIDAHMAENARQGGESYDNLRQATNRALFGAQAGPGSNRAEYNQRLQQVMQRLRSGLDLATLQVYFSGGRNAAVMCAHRWGVTIGECDALIAAATLTPTALPYLPPDDGQALQQQLREERVNRRVAREIANKVGETMLNVPGVLTNDSRGRTLVALLDACPGGTSDREQQIRAWHVGPAPGLVHCIAGALHARGGAASAQEAFDLSPRAARALVAWGEPVAATVATPTPTPPPPPPTNTNRNARNGRTPQVTASTDVQTLRRQGASLMRARQYPAAVQAYQAAVQADPSHAPTFAALGAAQMAARNPAAAAQALRKATELAPQNDGYLVGLARALVGNRQNADAIAALQAAVNINYDNMEAREGLRALGGEIPDPPLPEHPARDQIIAAMRPLKPGLAGCAPMFGGQVIFHVAISGETGNVAEARLEEAQGGELDADTTACMVSVVQSARFPRFTRESFEISYPYQIAAPE